jgi:hypothetical protein
MEYQVFSADEWLYPDSEVTRGPGEISLTAARGTRVAAQVLVNGVESGGPLTWSFDQTSGVTTTSELFQLEDVMVEMNTGPIGFVAREGEDATPYTTRKAPFRVFDCMKPVNNEGSTRAMTEGLYIAWWIPADAAGTVVGTLRITLGSDEINVPVSIEVFAVTVPEKGELEVTNWFNVNNMATRHDLEMWSEEHWEMIRKYGECMLRARQNHFWVPLSLTQITQKDDGTYAFDFTRTERLIRMYLDLGFEYIDGGHIAGRKKFSDAEFYVRGPGGPRATSAEAYDFLAQYLTEWKSFLEERGWYSRLVQHIGDEPIPESASDYRVLASIMRRFLPGVPLIDAIELPSLGGAVDIWVPKDNYYQEHREDFERHRSYGDTLWFYTCCFPGGHYLNRLLDTPLIRCRLLHWGNYVFDLKGFLHWGFNMYRDFQDPWEMNAPAHGSDGSDNLPPGDTHIAYPGDDGPWSSVRLEAQGRGAEDYELLRMLQAKNPKKADEIAALCLRDFKDYSENVAELADARKLLLDALT